MTPAGRKLIQVFSLFELAVRMRGDCCLNAVGILTILVSGEVHVQKQCKQQLFVRIAATQITDNGVE